VEHYALAGYRLTEEGTPISLKAEKRSKHGSREQCKAQTKAGGMCAAPAVERGLCFFHAHPEKLAELGRQGGKSNRRWNPADGNVSKIPLKSIADVSGLLEETINRVRHGPFDLRAANAIGFLASVLLRSLEQGPIEERMAKIEATLAANASQTKGP
jgi:hypothetical protein